jgi:hypothetical protein
MPWYHEKSLLRGLALAGAIIAARGENERAARILELENQSPVTDDELVVIMKWLDNLEAAATVLEQEGISDVRVPPPA